MIELADSSIWVWIGGFIFLCAWIIGLNLYSSRAIKTPPKFCTLCGCPIEKEWHEQWKKYDKNTGQGTQGQEAYWTCKNNDPLRVHYFMRTGETRVVSIKSRCDVN